jgi:hypothetical protein
VSIVDNHQGAFDTPFETAATADFIKQTFITTPADAAALDLDKAVNGLREFYCLPPAGC